jgi:site-specific recombinase XerD
MRPVSRTVGLTSRHSHAAVQSVSELPWSIDVGGRTGGPILLNIRGARMDRHAATRRLRHLAEVAAVRIIRPHPHMLRHTYVTAMLDAGVDLRDVQIAARHADPRTTMRYGRARKNLDRHPNNILAAYAGY